MANSAFNPAAYSVGGNFFKSDEAVTGLVNGSNTSYTTTSPYIGGTLEVFVNGLRQARTTHVTETTPASGVFTLDAAPQTGDIVRVNYQTTVAQSQAADTVDTFHANSTPTPNTLMPLNASGKFGSNVLKPSSINFLDSNSSNFTTTSSSYVDITGVTTSYTSGATAERLFIWFQGMAMIGSVVAASITLNIGGTDQDTETAWYPNTSGQWTTFSKLYIYDVAANTTITIKGRAKISGGATLTFQRNTSYLASIRGFAISQ